MFNCSTVTNYTIRRNQYHDLQTAEQRIRWTISRKAKIMQRTSVPRASAVVGAARRRFFVGGGGRWPAEAVGGSIKLFFACRQIPWQIRYPLYQLGFFTIVSSKLKSYLICRLYHRHLIKGKCDQSPLFQFFFIMIYLYF